MIEIHPSSFPGKCIECRHANLKTIDFSEGRRPACRFGYSGWIEKICDQQLKNSETGELVKLWLFEKYDGSNNTWAIHDQIRIIIIDDYCVIHRHRFNLLSSKSTL